METAFTPITSLIGGLCIGLAAVMLMATTGRIAGCSGLLGSLVPNPATWRFSGGERLAVAAAFVLGLLLVPLFASPLVGSFEVTLVASLPLMALAGLLVGFGAFWGSGCTSGHGVCGLSRLSVRSMIATAVFMLTGIVVVWFIRHGLGG